jgi:hypothetical protein
MTGIEILLDRTRHHAVEFLNGLDRRPLHPTATLKELRSRLGAPLPSALAADFLVSTWDSNAALYLSAPAAAVVEEVAGRWVKDILG